VAWRGVAQHVCMDTCECIHTVIPKNTVRLVSFQCSNILIVAKCLVEKHQVRVCMQRERRDRRVHRPHRGCIALGFVLNRSSSGRHCSCGGQVSRTTTVKTASKSRGMSKVHHEVGCRRSTSTTSPPPGTQANASASTQLQQTTREVRGGHVRLLVKPLPSVETSEAVAARWLLPENHGATVAMKKGAGVSQPIRSGLSQRGRARAGCSACVL
jgi:hypothetical protein